MDASVIGANFNQWSGVSDDHANGGLGSVGAMKSDKIERLKHALIIAYNQVKGLE